MVAKVRKKKVKATTKKSTKAVGKAKVKKTKVKTKVKTKAKTTTKKAVTKTAKSKAKPTKAAKTKTIAKSRLATKAKPTVKAKKKAKVAPKAKAKAVTKAKPSAKSKSRVKTAVKVKSKAKTIANKTAKVKTTKAKVGTKVKATTSKVKSTAPKASDASKKKIVVRKPTELAMQSKVAKAIITKPTATKVIPVQKGKIAKAALKPEMPGKVVAKATPVASSIASTSKKAVKEKKEPYMDEAQLKYFKELLENWKRELMEEVDHTIIEMKEASNLADPNDRATQEETFGLELRTRDRERKLLKKIEETLQQIDAQEYGYCESCGLEIGAMRLKARPTATLCIDCKTLAEIKEKRA